MLLFCTAASYFLIRGPWRAVSRVNSYDFASVYGATRCWLAGENPYDMPLVNRALRAAGDDNVAPPPSVYLPTAFPLIASVAWLSWTKARLVWSLLSVAVFAGSVILIFRSCNVPSRWLLAAGVLLFSPASSGLSTGNPSVLSCGLTLAAIFLALEKRSLAAAICLGLAHSLKPQISLAGLAVILVWRYWRILLLSLIIPLLAAAASFARSASIAQYKLWLISLKNGIADISLPGSLNDASPANFFSYHLINAAAILSIWIRNPAVISVMTWLLVALLAAIYFRFRTRNAMQDIAFFCTLLLIPVYHRYYDAQLLLGILPFLLGNSKRKAAIWVCLLVLLFPLQAIFATAFPALHPSSLAGFILLRHQPVIILLLCTLLMP